MSTELTLQTNTLPAHVQRASAMAAKFNADATGGISAGFPRISIRGSRFRIVKGGEETVIEQLFLDVVLVGANPTLSKQFYKGAYSPDDEGAAPECYSNDGIHPDPQSAEPQCTNCTECEQNIWGSKITPQGTETKACADLKRIAVVAAGDIDGDVFALQVPAASLKGFGNYISKLNGRGVSAVAVKTRLTFDTDAAFPKLMFDATDFLDETTMDAALARCDTDIVRVVIGEMGHTIEVEETASETASETAGEVVEGKAKTKPVTKKTTKKTTKKKVTKKTVQKPAKEPEPAPEPAKEATSVNVSAFGGDGAEAAETATVDDSGDGMGDLEDELDDILSELDETPE